MVNIENFLQWSKEEQEAYLKDIDKLRYEALFLDAEIQKNGEIIIKEYNLNNECDEDNDVPDWAKQTL